MTLYLVRVGEMLVILSDGLSWPALAASMVLSPSIRLCFLIVSSEMVLENC